jgi:D-amino peptidase
MRYFISVDMEGISGLVNWSDPASKISQFMSAEVLAVIQGIEKKDPAPYIVICDAHDSGENLDILSLPPYVKLIQGRTRSFYMIEGYEKGFDAALLIGYHAPVGTQQGLMDHSYSSSSFFDVTINGVSVGESEINAILLSEAKIPVILISGDDQLEIFSKPNFPQTEFVVTKRSIGKFCAELVHPSKVHEEITCKVGIAIDKLPQITCYAPLAPYTVEITVVNTLLADFAALMPGVTRLDGRKLRYTAKDGREMYRYMMSLLMIVSAAKK